MGKASVQLTKQFATIAFWERGLRRAMWRETQSLRRADPEIHRDVVVSQGELHSSVERVRKRYAQAIGDAAMHEVR